MRPITQMLVSNASAADGDDEEVSMTSSIPDAACKSSISRLGWPLRKRLITQRLVSNASAADGHNGEVSMTSSIPDAACFSSMVGSSTPRDTEDADRLTEPSDGDRTPTRTQSPPSGGFRSDGPTTPPPGLSTNRSSRMDLELLDEVTCEELVEMLSLTESTEEQGDLIYFIWLKKGPDWEVKVGERSITVRGLMEEAYARACRERVWWLVRLGAGLLEKKMDDIARALGDLLVRQKQVTVGMPGPTETILDIPLPPAQIQSLIRKACGGDVNQAMLSQEILVYLGIFVRTEPALFGEMLRLRLGLIIGLLATELERARFCSDEMNPTAALLNLSPYDVKTLLFNILSGKEIEAILPEAMPQSEAEERKIRNFNQFVNRSMRFPKKQLSEIEEEVSESEEESSAEEEDDDVGGFWLRRRCIDGALNRVPPEFYARVWGVLSKAPAGINLANHLLDHGLTKEMTRREIKFALVVEAVLNKVQEPEYRQLLVEAVMVLSLVAESHSSLQMPQGQIVVDSIIRNANALFLEDQAKELGDASECCVGGRPCGAVNGVCVHFYDSPPSGHYGTLTYLTRALVGLSPSSNTGQDLECFVS